MNCKQCKGTRIASISSKSSDLNYITVGANSNDGYVPNDMGIGGGDYIKFSWCLDCGQIQGAFGLPSCKLESGDEL
jgi:hypothetical protein